MYDTIDTMVLRLGAIIDINASKMGKRKFGRWVRDELPFDAHTARRCRAIYLAYRELPEEMLTEMPEPWQALFTAPLSE